MMINALSFDLEDWFHNTHLEKYLNRSLWKTYPPRAEENTEKILSLLRSKGVYATFFVLGQVAERHPDLIRKISEQGHEIATHGWSHTRAYQQTPQEFESELKQSIKLLESITGEKVLGHRAACFSITANTQWVIDVLMRNDLAYDSSIFPIMHDKYGMVSAPRFPYVLRQQEGKKLIEFPPSTCQFFGMNIPVAGGGYFRLYPYQLTRMFISNLNRQGKPAIVYLHPPEFDTHQPELGIDPLNKFRIYIGVKGNFKKLKKLLGDFRFAPVKQVLNNLGLTLGR